MRDYDKEPIIIGSYYIRKIDLMVDISSIQEGI